MGRPKKSATTRTLGDSLSIANEIRCNLGAIRSSVGMYIAHNFIHKVLKDL